MKNLNSISDLEMQKERISGKNAKYKTGLPFLFLFQIVLMFGLPTQAQAVTAYVTFNDYSCFSSQNPAPGHITVIHSTDGNWQNGNNIGCGWADISGNVTNLAINCGSTAGYFFVVFNNNNYSQATNVSTTPSFYTSSGYIGASGSFNITVTCTVPDVTPPVFQSAATNTTGTLVNLTYNDNMECSYANNSDFTVNVNASPITVSNISYANTIVSLTVSPSIQVGQTVTVSLNNASEGIVDCAYNASANLTNQAVTNNVVSLGPVVTTQAVSAIATTSATGNGNITSLSGGTTTVRGAIIYAYTDTDKIIGDAGVTNVAENGSFTTGAFTSSLTSLSVNTRYNSRAYATTGDGTGYGARVDFWTLANVPSASTVNNPTATTLDVLISVNGNPSTTTFAIQETSTGNFVQSNGSLGVSAVWQTASAWGTKTVTGLTAGNTYTFQVKARNGASTETAYGATSSGVPVTAPTVTTQAVSSLTATTSTGNGNITALNGGTTTVRGTVIYAYTDTDKIIGDAGVTNVAENGSFTIGAFTSSLTSLSVNTRYNTRAYATTEHGSGYGSRVDFWTLANVPSAPTVNNPTATTLDVLISVNGNPSTTTFAIQETSTGNFVQSNGSLGVSAVWQTASAWGTKTVTGLTTANTYTFQVKARNGASTETAYGATSSGVPVTAPTVTTQAVSSLSTTSATGNGNITATNGANATVRGTIFYPYTNTDLEVGGLNVTNISENGDFGTGAFTSTLTPLSVNTQYNARAYATTIYGTGYGVRVSFWTLANVPSAPTVNNPSLTTLDVTINSNGNPANTEFAIQETGGNYVQVNGTLAGGVVWQNAATWGTKTVTGLTTANTYTFQVKARNGASTETAFGATANGVPVAAPTVTTQAVSNLAATSATGNGNITATNGANATVRGTIFYPYTNTDLEIGGLNVTNISENGDFGTGAFTSTLTPLSVNTQYNARAYATTIYGTGYGVRVSFWTLANVPSAPTVNNPSLTTLDVTINTNGNPANTEFAIQETGGNYVQVNGTLAGGVVWQNAATWGTKTVTGLTAGTTYTFQVKARNGATTETAFGATAQAVTLSPEMNVTGNSVSIADGNVIPSNSDDTDFGNCLITNTNVDKIFTIENIGTGSLILTGFPLVVISGANAEDFTVTQTPISPVAANNSTIFTISFDPSSIGLKTATLSIANSDSDENPYTFTIQGNGINTPTVQATNIAFSSITRTSMTVKWTRGDGEGSVLLGKEKYRIPAEPLTDGNTYENASSVYTSAPVVSGAKVLYWGTSANPSVNVTSLTRYQLVYFKVCEFNNPSAPAYLQTEVSSNPGSRWTLRRDGFIEEDLTIDAEYAYPNPATNSISTTLDVFEEGVVSAALYDIEGRKVIELYNQTLPFGSHNLTFDICNVPSGVYQLIMTKGSEAIAYPVAVVR